ncbi:hypothetical protein Thivi_1943 [Thiocystis violascens DSM 198]|uniref:Uncharacterized protein n=1 Tax=Thiocystis violascens (strain ATCC 17096 / DSM 198 / 6111) TaxID=765911 RepID=I3YA84_THIV6|nr:hypothetical protein Thivi_1943 [Thiocystis violascens DSM 198]
MLLYFYRKWPVREVGWRWLGRGGFFKGWIIGLGWKVGKGWAGNP